MTAVTFLWKVRNGKRSIFQRCIPNSEACIMVTKVDMTYDEVYNEVIKFYPLGLTHTDPEFAHYPGLMRRRDLNDEKLQPDNYKKWKDLIRSVKFPSFRSLSASPESNLFDPCYTGRFLLQKKTSADGVLTRELYVRLSVLGPYYTIYGIDSEYLRATDPGHASNLVVHVSPRGFYEPFFLPIRNLLEQTYGGSKFIPYYLLSTVVPLLCISGGSYGANNNAKIFQALFSSRDITNSKVEGDIYYE
jgi:hypothetical protein